MEVKRQITRDMLVALARGEGLKTMGQRFECPNRCSQKTDARACNTSDTADGAMWVCHHGCGAKGSAIDLLMCTRKSEAPAAADALKEWIGGPAAKRAAHAQQRKIERDAVALWEKLSPIDPIGTAYLKSRKLERAIDLGWVRFNVGKSGDKWLDERAEDGFRPALALRDESGKLVTFQMRCVVNGISDNKRSLPGITTSGLVFGEPARARACAVVWVTEGIADTLAIAIEGVEVLGAPGQEQLGWVHKSIGNPRGKTFVLCAQNDPPVKKPDQKTSEQCFGELERALISTGAMVRRFKTPPEYKDVAAWRAAMPEEFSRRVLTLIPSEPTPSKSPAPKLRAVANDETAVPQAIIENAEDRPLSKSYASIVQVLRKPELRTLVLGEGELEYNEQTLMPCIARRPIRPLDMSRIRELCERQFVDHKQKPIEFARADIEQAVIAVAMERAFHPVVEYLRGLKWDATERIEHVAEDILQIDNPPKLASVLLRKWMISAVARALDPGCKVDTVLILVGKQGHKKSTFFETLAGREFFSDAQMNLDNKDALLILHSAWVHEWAELEAMQRARDQGSVKAFVTRRVDRFRRPYGRDIEDFKRPCVIVGTTNEQGFLTDPTGSRRYQTIEVAHEINVAGLRAQRDQLWAEAVVAYDKSEQWWLDDTEERNAAASREKFEQVDPWEATIGSALDRPAVQTGQHAVTTEWLAADVLLIPPKDRDKATEMRIGAALTRLHYKRVRRSDGKGHRPYVWVKEEALL